MNRSVLYLLIEILVCTHALILLSFSARNRACLNVEFRIRIISKIIALVELLRCLLVAHL